MKRFDIYFPDQSERHPTFYREMFKDYLDGLDKAGIDVAYEAIVQDFRYKISVMNGDFKKAVSDAKRTELLVFEKPMD